MNRVISFFFIWVLFFTSPLMAVRIREKTQRPRYILPKEQPIESTTSVKQNEEPFRNRLASPKNSSRKRVVTPRQRIKLPKETEQKRTVSRGKLDDGKFKNRVLSPDYNKPQQSYDGRKELRGHFLKSQKDQLSYQERRKVDRFPKTAQKRKVQEKREFKPKSSHRTKSLFSKPKAEKERFTNPRSSSPFFSKSKPVAEVAENETMTKTKNKYQKRTRTKNPWRLP